DCPDFEASRAHGFVLCSLKLQILIAQRIPSTQILPESREILLTVTKRYGYIKNHKKTVKNKQSRTRELEEFKKKPKNQSRSQKSQALVKFGQRKVNHKKTKPKNDPKMSLPPLLGPDNLNGP
ncbi:hypothetical protein Tco_1251128, partial [Tanacetum coccineum]